MTLTRRESALSPTRSRPRRGRRAAVAALCGLGLLGAGLAAAPAASAAPAPAAEANSNRPDLGPNTLVFDPSMPLQDIQNKLDAVAAQQVPNQFGPERVAVLFKPGTYGTASQPLAFQVGYYTSVAGLGASPTDVTINGHIDVTNQCTNGFCVALNNFWRSLSNLTINVTAPSGMDGCRASGNFWAVSQAAPMRRVNVTGGNLTLMDYCSGPSFASGGYIADSQLPFVINGSQQQWFMRDSSVTGWSNGVWNQVFSGVVGAPAECFPAGPCGGPYTTNPTTAVSKDAPFLYVDGSGDYRVFVPALRRDASGPSWTSGPTKGESIGIGDFYVASPSDSAQTINSQLARGRNLLLTPGVYHLDRALEVRRDDTVVLGLGFATLVPTNGNAALRIADVRGVSVAGITVDAGTVNSPVLIQVGKANGQGHKKASAEDPISLHDVFVRIGGAIAGKATTSIVVDSDYTILDDIWAWRADHGEPGTVGWDVNTADTGLVVNADNVSAYGLFVEHYQKDEVVWNGENGRVVFFQNEMPYDPPSQAAWTQPDGALGYPAMRVADGVKSFSGTGMGSYSFFNQGIDIFADNAFRVPSDLPTGSLHNLLTIFLDPANGKGGIKNVVNGVGGSSTIANPDVPVTVVNYP